MLQTRHLRTDIRTAGSKVSHNNSRMVYCVPKPLVHRPELADGDLKLYQLVGTEVGSRCLDCVVTESNIATKLGSKATSLPSSCRVVC